MKHKTTLAALAWLFITMLFTMPSVMSAEDIPNLTRKAKKGDVEAQLKMARLYAGIESDPSIKPNDSKAEDWYIKAVNQGSIDGVWGLGSLYEKHAQYSQAIETYNKLAQKENSEAIYKIATLIKKYGHKEVFSRLHDRNEKVISLYREAAAKGHTEAQYQIGILLTEKNRNDRRNAAEAAEWWLKAAGQGHAKAQCDLAFLYHTGSGVKKNNAEAVNWWRKSADQGNGLARYYLGFMYENGLGVEKNESEAVNYYRKAAEQGIAEAQFIIGSMYSRGKGTLEKNASEAASWYAKAAEQGHAGAQNNLGFMYENGNGVTKDAGKAMAWYLKAADQEDQRAQYHIATLYENGVGVPKDDTKAVEWLSKAAEYVSGGKKIRSKRLPDRDALYNLALRYKEGRGVLMDDSEYKKLFFEAAQQGHAEAQYQLGRWKEERKRDIPDRRRRQTKEDSNNNPIGDSYEFGAKAWYLGAAEQGHTEAQYKLGTMNLSQIKFFI